VTGGVTGTDAAAGIAWPQPRPSKLLVTVNAPVMLIARVPCGAVDMRVHSCVIQGAGQDRHRDRAGTAAADGPLEIAALPGGDTADDQPDDEKQ
jgi:hypothetical protein